MKKNYIEHLRQYDARTTPMVKLDNYRKKFIKTVYEKDKQNINPNLPSKEMKKGQMSRQRKQNGKCKSHQGSRQNTEQRQRRSSQATKKKESKSEVLLRESYGELKMQCIKIQRNIQQKYEEEIQKCKMYYQWIHQELQEQEQKCIKMINSVFQAAFEEVQKVNNQLDLDFKVGSTPSCEWIQLELMEIVVGDDVKIKIHDYLQQVDIANILTSLPQKSLNSSKCGLQCSEQLIDTDLDNFQQQGPQKKWYNPQPFNPDCPVVYQATQSEEGISPSFKQF